MKKILIFLLVGLMGWAIPQDLIAATIQNIRFQKKDQQSVINISSDQALEYEQRLDRANNQFVLKVKNAKLSQTASRRLDTAAFNSVVTGIQPRAAKKGEASTQIEIGLKNPQTPNVNQKGNNLLVRFNDPAGSSDQASQNFSQKNNSFEKSAGNKKGKEPGVDEFIQNRKRESFEGSPITLQVRDADVRHVLQLISDASGFNIIVGPDVSGTITLSLKNVPWDQVLNVVLNTLNLGAQRNRNVLRVMTLDNLTREKRQKLEAKRVADESQKKLTKIFPISYADPSKLKGILSKFDISNIEVDTRTNSIIVHDIREHLDQAKRMIDLLDQETPQVMVESKIVEASEDFSSSFGGSIGLSGIGDTGGENFVSLAGANPTDGLIGSPGVFEGGEDIASATDGVSLGISPQIGFLNLDRLNAFLKWAQTDSQVKVVSTPKIVVLNQESAKILQSKPVILQSTTISNGVVRDSPEILQANVSLNVTPTVTNDESVLMDLQVNRDVPQSSDAGNAVANRNISTKVVVDDGATLVIGGLYTVNKQEQSSGVPYLKDIPILGALFGSGSESTSKSELFIFITPRILNPKKSGYAQAG